MLFSNTEDLQVAWQRPIKPGYMQLPWINQHLRAGSAWCNAVTPSQVQQVSQHSCLNAWVITKHRTGHKYRKCLMFSCILWVRLFSYKLHFWTPKWMSGLISTKLVLATFTSDLPWPWLVFVLLLVVVMGGHWERWLGPTQWRSGRPLLHLGACHGHFINVSNKGRQYIYVQYLFVASALYHMAPTFNIAQIKQWWLSIQLGFIFRK